MPDQPNTIVTGGTRGLGLEITRSLARGGRKVVAVARRKTAEFEQLAGEHAGLVQFAPYDLNETSGIEALVRQIRKEHGPSAALVNNAAIGVDGILTTLKDVDIEAALRVNLLAPILLAKAVGKKMMADGGGNIVNVSSVNAFTGYSGLSAYAATKAGLIGFTKSLAREFGRAGIRVNAVAPGLLETDMVGAMADDRRETIKRRSPLGRFATTMETANAVMFLLSEQSAGMTGSVITVDAGNSA